MTFKHIAGMVALGVMCATSPIAPTLTANADVPLMRESPDEAKLTVTVKKAYLTDEQIAKYKAKAVDGEKYTYTFTFDSMPFIYKDDAGKLIFDEGKAYKSFRTRDISTLLPIPKDRGYKFLGWSFTETKAGETTEDTGNTDLKSYFNRVYADGTVNTDKASAGSVKDEMTLYPVFVKSDIKIRYHLQQKDGSFKDIYFKDAMSFKTGESVALNSPSADEIGKGYIFAGWYKDAELKSAVTDNSVFDIDNVKTVDAKADNPDYYIDVYGKVVAGGGKLTLDAMGGKFKSDTMNYTSESHALPTPVKSGAVFLGWYEDAAGTVAVTDSSFQRNGNMTVYAKWQAIKLGRPTIKLANKKKGKLNVTVKKNYVADGFGLQISTSKSFKDADDKESKGNVNVATIKKVKKGGTYYVRVRTYKTDSTGNPVYSKWSKSKKIAVKK